MMCNTPDFIGEPSVSAEWPDAINDDYDLYVQIKENIGSQLDADYQVNLVKETDNDFEQSVEIEFENANQDSNLDELEKIWPIGWKKPKLKML